MASARFDARAPFWGDSCDLTVARFWSITCYVRVAQEPGDPGAAGGIGPLAVAAILVIAILLTLLRAASGAPLGTPALGLLGFFAVFAGPGFVAAVGLRRGRPDVILAAAAVLICLAPLSMGGATFPLLIPAVILLYLAGKLRAPSVPGWLRAATAVVTIGLLVAAPVALFSTTQVVCWDNYGGGNVDVRVLPEMPNEVSSIAPFGSGCSGGEISGLGGSLAVLAVAGAVAVAMTSGSAVAWSFSPR
jgi:hypothetical protein